MRLLKIVSVIFLIYFIRRFMQMYRVMEQIQKERAEAPKAHRADSETNRKENKIIEADFKVVDR